MRIAIPYNEILPTQKAHDAFLFREADELARAGCDVSLLIGKGSKSQPDLHHYYGASQRFHIDYLPIVRKNNPLNLSWNRPFFMATASKLRHLKPDVVLLSVVKQAAHLTKQKSKHSLYVYEAHELAYYPTTLPKPYFNLEKQLLEQVDLIVVTTNQLKAILMAPPYQLKTPIIVTPLAVDATPLPPPSPNTPPTITYVGQLYKGQGLERLIKLMKTLPEVRLRIVGGCKADIERLNPHIPNVIFEGFIPPNQLQEHLVETHAFIAPFEMTGRMPYVAHTKLYQYGAWGRVVIAPDCPIVHEHLSDVWTYCDEEELRHHLLNVGKAPMVDPKLSTWSDRINTLLSHF